MADVEQQEAPAPVAEREAAQPVGGARRAWSSVRGLLVGRPETGALFGAAVLFVIFAFISSSRDLFLTRTNLAGMASITAELGIVAMAVTLLMIAGQFDLSVGSALGLSSMLVPWLMVQHNAGALEAFVIAFLAAVGIGLLNGGILVIFRIPSFIITLGTLLILRSLVLKVSGGFPVEVPQGSKVFTIFSHRMESGPLHGYQVSIFWFLGVLVTLTFLLLRTRFGNWIFAAGGNERAARSMGVPVDRVWVILFIVTALAAFLTGVIQAGRFDTVEATRGQLYELQAIAAAVIGGARLNGGYGSVLGAALGAFMIAMIQQGLVLSGVASYWLNFAVGALIIGAVVLNQVLALVGDNGAGKSTMIKILTGLFPPDRGEILWDGEAVRFGSPRDAYDLGVATVYQDLAIVDLMSIYRNVFLGREKAVTRGIGPLRFLDRKKAQRDARKAIADIGIQIRDPDEAIARMSGGERQSIAIARAAYFNPKLLILDEPTSALSLRQTDRVLTSVEEARNKGISIIFITHNVHHVYPVADRFVVLWHGESIAEFKRGEHTKEELSELIVEGKPMAERLGHQQRT